jgi:hypothetical protein
MHHLDKDEHNNSTQNDMYRGMKVLIIMITTIRKLLLLRPRVVAHACNPATQEDCDSRSAWTKSIQNSTSISKKLGLMACGYHPN